MDGRGQRGRGRALGEVEAGSGSSVKNVCLVLYRIYPSIYLSVIPYVIQMLLRIMLSVEHHALAPPNARRVPPTVPQMPRLDYIAGRSNVPEERDSGCRCVS